MIADARYVIAMTQPQTVTVPIYWPPDKPRPEQETAVVATAWKVWLLLEAALAQTNVTDSTQERADMIRHTAGRAAGMLGSHFADMATVRADLTGADL